MARLKVVPFRSAQKQIHDLAGVKGLWAANKMRENRAPGHLWLSPFHKAIGVGPSPAEIAALGINLC